MPAAIAPSAPRPGVRSERASLQVAFDAGHLLERGTDVALYDYAVGNEEQLGNRSRILCPAQADLSALDKFRARFSVLLYRDRSDLERCLADVDVYYRIDHGQRPAEPLPRPPYGRTVVHCVFTAHEPHGDVYAAVSSWVARHRGVPGQPPCPVVPHIVQLPRVDGDLRAVLGIPAGATVFGRHGGPDTFDLPFVHQEVLHAVQQRDDLWFVFLNTRPFAPPHPRIVHLDKTTDLAAKARFVQTCDAMLHARADGESFGLAVGEFSVHDKPVVTWLGGHDRYHLEVLGPKGIYYRDANDLRRILRVFRPVQGDFDAYSAPFSPAVVMRQFDAVFLQGAAAGAARSTRSGL
ncbi:MAG: hypothetical protein JNL08_15685 [Planctomycetes bacterium]|nr:hypothetical protein [Planctomycetota bacterium]